MNIDKFKIADLINKLSSLDHNQKIKLVYEWVKTDHITLGEYNELTKYIIKPLSLMQFKESKNEIPVVKVGFTRQVYFIANDKLYKGEYHMNKYFYSYKSFAIECMATIDGSKPITYSKLTGTPIDAAACTHWCYVEDFKLN